MVIYSNAFFLTTLAILSYEAVAQYKPDWDSIDSRPIPEWYDDAKFGIFCHWGVYSVPAHRSEWLWWYWKGTQPEPEVAHYMSTHYKQGTTYADLANLFTAIDFDPAQFADIVTSSGAKYFVLTSKHHEGFTMWPSSASWNWNSVDIGPHRDIVGELKRSIINRGIHFGVYFSLFEWFNPLYISDVKENTTTYVDQVSYPQMLDLIHRYQPEILWSDGDGNRPDTYWRSKEFLAWLYNESPVKDKIVTNDRWGRGIIGKHGGFLTFDDDYDPGYLIPRKWENCMTLDKKSWGYRRDMKVTDILTAKYVILKLARTISCGGNLLLNVGPDDYGRIVPIFQERLEQIGKFVNAHSEAIFGTKPWVYQNDSDYIWYTSRLRNSEGFLPQRIYNPQNSKNTIIYAFVLEWPKDNQVRLPSVKPTPNTKAFLLGPNIPLQTKSTTGGITVDIGPVDRRKFPSLDAFVLKIEYAATSMENPLRRLQRVEQKLKKV